MIINNKRALAYTAIIHDIKDIPGADNIQLGYVNAWSVIIKKNEFKEGDKVVFFEIDSLVPANNPAFSFLQKTNYKIKTYRLNKFKVVSQGLVLPLSDFPEVDPATPIETDVTELLKIKYYVAEDNVRKATSADARKERFRQFKFKHHKFFGTSFMQWLCSKKWFYNIMLKFFGKPDKKRQFPKFISKTDEERVQNIPSVLDLKTPMVVTEKIDGTSTTIAVKRKFLGYEVYVCSRNLRYPDKDQKCYMQNDNIYWDMALKYDIINKLKLILKNNKELKWVAVQGESFGPKWQGNPLKLNELDFRAFNLIDSKNGRLGSVAAASILEGMGIPFVPIVSINYVLPDTVEELITAATGPSALNPEVLREGWVIRSFDGTLSFKAVSTEYLLSKKD